MSPRILDAPPYPPPVHLSLVQEEKERARLVVDGRKSTLVTWFGDVRNEHVAVVGSAFSHHTE